MILETLLQSIPAHMVRCRRGCRRDVADPANLYPKLFAHYSIYSVQRMSDQEPYDGRLSRTVL